MFNICCPDCFSKNLYKFGFDPNHNIQKFFCKDCSRQFTERSFSNDIFSSKYPKCPVCGKGTYLHHDYTYYSNFTCNDKSCNHSFNVIKDSAIKNISSKLINNSAVKRIRTKLHIIVDALYLYFINNSTTRAISNFFKDRYNFSVSHVAIHKWTTKFASVFKSITESMFPSSLHLSDEWHVDETVINIHGKRHYLWTLLDSETRFVIDYHLSPSREASEAFALFNAAKIRVGAPNSIVSDRLPSYTFPAKSIFPNSKHIKVQKFSDDITNNLIESFFSKFKAHHKAHRGLKSFESVNNLLYSFFFCYNYIRPHGSLNNLTPAQVAGVSYSENSRKNLLLF